MGRGPGYSCKCGTSRGLGLTNEERPGGKGSSGPRAGRTRCCLRGGGKGMAWRRHWRWAGWEVGVTFWSQSGQAFGLGQSLVWLSYVQPETSDSVCREKTRLQGGRDCQFQARAPGRPLAAPSLVASAVGRWLPPPASPSCTPRLLSACASFLCNGSPLRVLFGQLGQPASCSFSQTRLQCAQASPFCQFCRGCLTGALKYGRDGGLLPGAGACQPDWPGPGWEPASHTGPSVSRMSPLLSQMRGWGQSVWASLYGLLGTLQL